MELFFLSVRPMQNDPRSDTGLWAILGFGNHCSNQCLKVVPTGSWRASSLTFSGLWRNVRPLFYFSLRFSALSQTVTRVSPPTSPGRVRHPHCRTAQQRWDEPQVQRCRLTQFFFVISHKGFTPFHTMLCLTNTLEPPHGSQQYGQSAEKPGCNIAGHRNQETACSAAER